MSAPRVNLSLALTRVASAKALANGQTADLRSAPLKESAITTFRAILKAAMRRSRAGLAPADDGLYWFRFTNAEIAAAAGCSGRTVIRHRAALASAGLIAGYRFRGDQHPYELALRGEYLGLVVPVDRDAAAEAVAALMDAAAEEAPLPSPSPSEDRMSALPEDQRKNQENSGVGKGALRAVSPDGTEARKAGTPPGRHGGRAPETSRGAAPGADWRDIGAELLWGYARRELWHGVPLTPRQVSGAKAHIRAIYARVPVPELDAWHRRFVGMVRAAADYVGRDPARFVPSPDLWFSPAFKHGFRATYPWHMAREAAQSEARADVELQRCWRIWEKNEKAYPSRRRDPVALFRELTERVAANAGEARLRIWLATFAREGGHDA